MRAAIVVVSLAISMTAAADPKDLAAEAKTHERAAEWDAAREAYVKLEAFDDWRGKALYGEAYASFQQGDFVAAEQLAAKAAIMPHAPRAEARQLYGDALFKRKEFARARGVYVAIEKDAPRPTKTLLQKKIAACDAMLRKSA